MEYVASIDPPKDRLAAKSGDAVVIASLFCQIILLTYNTDQEEYLVQAHLSAEFIDGDRVFEYKGHQYAYTAYDGLAILTDQTAERIWSKIYADSQHECCMKTDREKCGFMRLPEMINDYTKNRCLKKMFTV